MPEVLEKSNVLDATSVSNTSKISDISIEEIEIKNDSLDENSLLEEILEMDLLCYGRFDEKDTGPVSYWKEIGKYSFLQLAYFKNKLIGYINIHRFSDKGIDMLSKGMLRDGEMFDYLDKDNKKKTSLYITSVVVLAEFRKIGIADKLLQQAFKRIEKEGYIFDKIYATLWTEGGKNFFSKFHPKIINHDVLGHDVVEMTFLR